MSGKKKRQGKILHFAVSTALIVAPALGACGADETTANEPEPQPTSNEPYEPEHEETANEVEPEPAPVRTNEPAPQPEPEVEEDEHGHEGPHVNEPAPG